MPLQKQTVALKINGLDTKSDARWVVPGQLVEAQNCYQEKTGNLTKRLGREFLGIAKDGGGVLLTAQRTAVFNDEILIEDTELHSLAETNDEWFDKGTCPVWTGQFETVKDFTFLDDGANQDVQNPDVARNGGYQVVVYERDADIYYMVMDTTTGTRVVDDQLVELLSQRTKVVAVGTSFQIYYWDTALTTLKVKRITVADPTTLSASTTITAAGGSGNASWDIQERSDVTDVGLAYEDSAGDIRVELRNEDMTLATGVTHATPQADNCMVWCTHDFSTSEVYLGISDATVNEGVRILKIDDTTLAINSTVTVSTSVLDALNMVGYFDGTDPVVIFNRFTAGISRLVKGDGITGIVVIRRGLDLQSRVVEVASKFYFMGLYAEGNVQNSNFLLDSDGNIYGRYMYSFAGDNRANGHVTHLINTSGAEYIGAVTFGAAGDDERLVLLTLNQSDTSRTAGQVLGGNLNIPGGYLAGYDGDICSENNFLLFPNGTSGIPSGGGSLDPSATYGYGILYEWYDASGNRHQSEVGLLTVVTGAAQGTVTLTIPTCRLTAKESGSGDIQIVIYRTEGDGTTLHRTGVVINSTAADTVVFVDTDADSVILDNEIIYTEGGVIDNQAGGACKIAITHRNRVWTAGLDNPLEAGYSKQFVEGVGVAFNLDFRVAIPDTDQGGITAMGSMDDKIVFFTKHSIYFLTGDGPNDLAQGLYGVPQRVSTQIGCEEPASVVRVPDGLMFKSTRGIYLLTRGLQMVYLGAAVEKFNSSAVTSGVVMEDLNQVRFTLGTLVDSQVILVYNWFFQQWYTFTAANPMTSAVVHKGLYAMLFAASASIFRELPGTFTDNLLRYNRRIVFAPASFAQVSGFQRIYRTQVHGVVRDVVPGVGVDTYRTIIRHAFNHSSTDTDNLAVESETISPPYNSRPSQQKCTSIRVTVEEDEVDPNEGSPVSRAGATVQGIDITGITFVVGVKQGVDKIPAAQDAVIPGTAPFTP